MSRAGAWLATPMVMVVMVMTTLLCGSGCHLAGKGPERSVHGAGAGGGSAGDSRLVRLPVQDDPTVTLEVSFPVGAAHDPAGKEGLAYITASLLEQGSTTGHRYEEILRLLYPLAASYQVSVDREMTVVGGRCHRDGVERFFPLFVDAFLHPAFDEADFQRVKTDTLSYLEKTLRFAQDEDLGKAALQSFVFDGTRYAHPVEGTVQGVRSLTLDDVRAFYRTHYLRSATAALGGGFDEQLTRRLLSAVDELPAGRLDPSPAPVPPVIHGRQVLLVAKPGPSASISLGLPIDVRRGERDFYALWLANSWLGEHRHQSGRLFQVIREKRGLNYGDYSYVEAYPGGGRRSTPPTHVGRRRQMFEVWIRTLPDAQAQFALRAAVREVQNLVEHGMTREQFELQREFLRKYILHFAETTSDRLAYAVDDRFYGLSPEGHLARFQRILGELTVEEVNAALKRHLRLADLKIAIVTGNAEALKSALEADAPSPIVYATPKDAAIVEEDGTISTLHLGIAPGVRIVPVEQVFER